MLVMKSLPAACMAALLAIAAGSLSSAAAQNRPVPTPNMPTGGSERAPREMVVGEAPDQILIRNIVGQAIYGRNGKRLGTVKDALVDRRRNSLDVLVLDIGSGKDALRPIAWSSVDTTNRKRLASEVTLADLKNTSGGLPLSGHSANNPDLVSVSEQLLGKRAIGRNQEELGTIHDLVATAGDGHLVALLVDTGTGLLGRGASRAVPWNLARLPDDKRQPVSLAMSKDDIAKEPRFETKGPEVARKNAPESGKTSSGPLNTAGRPAAPPGPPSTRTTE
jgi:sporulation protein YlmC with PRC-barrel domain